jgi:hypothetical protein
MEPANQGEVPKLSQVIQIDEGKIQEHLEEVVRSTVTRGRVPTSSGCRRRRCRRLHFESMDLRPACPCSAFPRTNTLILMRPTSPGGWRERYGKVNEHNGWVPRDFWLEDWEKQGSLRST